MGQLEVMTQLAPYCDYQFCSSHVSRAIGSLFYDIIDAINQEPDDFEKAALVDMLLKYNGYNATANQIVADMEKALNAAKVYRVDGVNVANANKVTPTPPTTRPGISAILTNRSVFGQAAVFRCCLSK